MKKQTKTAILAGTLFTGVLLVFTSKKRTGGTGAIVSPAVAKLSNGVVVKNGRLVVVDQTAWFRFVPEAVEEAVREGARGADGVMINVMRRSLPGYPWPPPADSQMASQWKAMVMTVAELLHLEPEPEPVSGGRNLRVV